MMKRWSGLVVLLLSVLALTACGEVPQAQMDDTGSPGGSVTIHILGGGTDPALDAAIDAYTAAYPNQHVEKVPLVLDAGQDVNNWLLSHMADGELDIVPTNFTGTSLVQDKLLLPLDPYIAKSGFDLKPLGTIPDALRMEGTLYELPSMLQPSVLLYNQDVFTRTSAPEPKAGWSWEEFRATANRFRIKDGYGFETQTPEGLVSLWLQEKGVGGSPSRQDLTQALTFFAGMALTDKSMPLASKQDWLHPGPMMMGRTTDPLTTGRAFMAPGPLTWNRSFQYSRMHIGMVPMPVPAGHPGSAPAYVPTLGIAGTTRHRDEAWQFLSFLAGPDGQAIMARKGTFPAYNTPETQTAWFEQEVVPPAETAGLFQVQWLVPPRYASRVPYPGPDIYQAANDALSGQKSVADAVAAWAARQK